MITEFNKQLLEDEIAKCANLVDVMFDNNQIGSPRCVAIVEAIKAAKKALKSDDVDWQKHALYALKGLA